MKVRPTEDVIRNLLANPGDFFWVEAVDRSRGRGPWKETLKENGNVEERFEGRSVCALRSMKESIQVLCGDGNEALYILIGEEP